MSVKGVSNIKKKILFGITSLKYGGAERVLVDIVNQLEKNYDVTIFSLYDNGELKQELSKNVKFKSLYKKSREELSKITKIINPISILLFNNHIYKKYIKEDFDIEIAFLEGPITRLFSVRNKTTKKVVWIHNDIKNVFGNSIKSRLKRIIDNKLYKKYEQLVFVSKDNMQSFRKIYRDIDSSRMCVIYNYIDKDKIIEKSKKTKIVQEYANTDNIKLLSVCRLVEQKAIDRFIRVHSRLIKNGLMHEVYIIGDGPQREMLEKMITDYNVEETFKMLGQKKNPYPYIKKADYFCLFSKFEGYGMVLEEAKVLNKYILITDTAAREAVESYKKSLIIKNSEEDMYNVLYDILKNQKNEKNSVEGQSYDNSDRLNAVIELIEKITNK